ncbi:hypothetical protein SAMN02745146_3135 [Hymenobacter daecheongensis DSM 21074]|uniref:Uncharacterized protein n=1 Tax=Hymenobacter daecheongensis DSM 21074 TaxID=1121955 RepID=A0A1M6J7W1_9BACT|nr:hypothetical protein [Hymenobacter daecheongensis]SHJ42803.1 hypothetical protein SAMN02745146_3135 [Hymenobacter daecheongensis DSM 21074]
MAIDVTLLLTRAQCDEVTKELDKRLRRLDNKEQNYDYQDEVGGEFATDLNQELTGLNLRIANFDSYLATLTAGTPEHDRTTDDRRKADDRRGDIQAQQRKRGGPKVVLGQSALKETQSRSASLEEDKAAVVAHRATLSA